MSPLALRTRELSDAPNYASVPRRPSLEEFRSDNASPSPTFADWPYLLADRLEEHAWDADDMTSHSHMSTSVATLEFREKREISGTPYRRPHELSSPSVDNARTGTSRDAGPASGYALDGKEVSNVSHVEGEDEGAAALALEGAAGDGDGD